MTAEPSDPSRAFLPHADARLASTIDDLFLAEQDRLDDRTRAALTGRLHGAVIVTERAIAAHAARALAAQGLADQADLLSDPGASVLARLIGSRLLRDAGLIEELLGQVRQDLLGAALAANRPAGSAPPLLSRLIDGDDAVVARAATGYLVAEGHRRQGARSSELPADLHRRLVWWIAAALRERDPAPSPALDRALADAALGNMAGHPEDERIEAAAARLAVVIETGPATLPDVIIDALDEGRAALVIALIAQATGIDFTTARALLLDPAGDGLWLSLRALGMERDSIARIALALADADHRRDIDSLADRLDSIAGIPAEAARAALAPVTLNADFRAAIGALARSSRA